MGERTLSYGEVQDLARRVAGALARSGVAPGGQGGDPVGQRPDGVRLRLRDRPRAGRCGARSTRATRRRRTASCSSSSTASACSTSPPSRRWWSKIAPELAGARATWSASTTRPALRGVAGRAADDRPTAGRAAGRRGDARRHRRARPGRPKGVMLTGRNLETMTALTLMGYPFEGRPGLPGAGAADPRRRGAVLPGDGARRRDRGHARRPTSAEFLALIERHARHAHVPAADADLHAARPTRRCDATDLSSLQCFWYGAAPMSAARLEEALTRIGPVMAPAVRADRGADDDLDAGARRPLRRRTARSPRERLSSAGRPAPLVTVAIMDARRDAAAARRARRDRRARLAGDGRLLQEPGGDRRGLARSAGTTPATSATSTTTASCSSSTAPRT